MITVVCRSTDRVQPSWRLPSACRPLVRSIDRYLLHLARHHGVPVAETLPATVATALDLVATVAEFGERGLALG
ncbi:MAG: hypothetical protein ACRDRD_18750 [Pseudonocardiaceae bacterium]